jgi:hypothetical protein
MTAGSPPRRTRLREAFTLDSVTALQDMKANGSGYEVEDVKAYFSAMSHHRKGLQAKPQHLQPTRLP